MFSNFLIPPASAKPMIETKEEKEPEYKLIGQHWLTHKKQTYFYTLKSGRILSLAFNREENFLNFTVTDLLTKNVAYELKVAYDSWQYFAPPGPQILREFLQYLLPEGPILSQLNDEIIHYKEEDLFLFRAFSEVEGFYETYIPGADAENRELENRLYSAAPWSCFIYDLAYLRNVCFNLGSEKFGILKKTTDENQKACINIDIYEQIYDTTNKKFETNLLQSVFFSNKKEIITFWELELFWNSRHDNSIVNREVFSLDSNTLAIYAKIPGHSASSNLFFYSITENNHRFRVIESAPILLSSSTCIVWPSSRNEFFYVTSTDALNFCKVDLQTKQEITITLPNIILSTVDNRPSRILPLGGCFFFLEASSLDKNTQGPGEPLFIIYDMAHHVAKPIPFLNDSIIAAFDGKIIVEGCKIYEIPKLVHYMEEVREKTNRAIDMHIEIPDIRNIITSYLDKDVTNPGKLHTGFFNHSETSAPSTKPFKSIDPNQGVLSGLAATLTNAFHRFRT